jgi:hypothetical protein
MAAALLFVATSGAAQNITKETIEADGAKRIFYLFVPEKLEDKQVPLIITLHGSGRDGRILVDHWKNLASKEGIILAGPDATVREAGSAQDPARSVGRYERSAVPARERPPDARRTGPPRLPDGAHRDQRAYARLLRALVGDQQSRVGLPAESSTRSGAEVSGVHDQQVERLKGKREKEKGEGLSHKGKKPLAFHLIP